MVVAALALNGSLTESTANRLEFTSGPAYSRTPKRRLRSNSPTCVMHPELVPNGI